MIYASGLKVIYLISTVQRSKSKPYHFYKELLANFAIKIVLGIDMLTSLQTIRRNVYGYFVANITKADKRY